MRGLPPSATPSGDLTFLRRWLRGVGRSWCPSGTGSRPPEEPPGDGAGQGRERLHRPDVFFDEALWKAVAVLVMCRTADRMQPIDEDHAALCRPLHHGQFQGRGSHSSTERRVLHDRSHAHEAPGQASPPRRGGHPAPSGAVANAPATRHGRASAPRELTLSR